MTTPAVTLASVKLKGNKLEFQGSVDTGGDAGLTLTFFLDPQPSGTSFGPFPLTPAGVAYAQSNTPLKSGKWKVRVVATPTTGAAITVASSELLVNGMKCRLVLPGLHGVAAPSAPTPGVVFGDAATQISYSQAIQAAPIGQVRVAAATNLVQMLGATPRLVIYQDSQPIVQVDYTGLFNVVNDGTDVTIAPSVTSNVTILQNADLTVGVWTFELQGDVTYYRSVRGSAGLQGSGANITIASNPVVGQGFASDYVFLMPRAMDGLS